MSIQPGINMEFIRRSEKPFATGLEWAAKMGYKYVEPMLHNGRELMSEAGYYHSVSMEEEPYDIKDLLDKFGLKASGVSAHCPLIRPEVSVMYLQRAIRFAAIIGAPVVNTDESYRPSWVTLDEAWPLMTYTLKAVLRVAERYNVAIGIEPHNEISRTTSGLLRIASLVDHPLLRINYDTGNAYLAGEDIYDALEQIGPRLVHMHAKDISVEHSDAERGKVTGTPVGCACGDGVVDWTRVVSICRKHGFEGVFSVECGTPEEAERSLSHLNQVLAAAGAAVA
ncbi:MAG: sugar phosphate isomerase/epimerase [Bryobacteraceae bacterium]|nr:sugar phosphate isomerase/epimerase [Bryobacterales bacterium]MEB2360518.1 sugar phosphate isomerase/epimerase [Bryobacterales bacterium]NUN00378.1 sugar phosphate isomerase/epimerase [Bryobacteraceae bacterium]